VALEAGSPGCGGLLSQRTAHTVQVQVERYVELVSATRRVEVSVVLAQ
jgi:hypothetical protein